MRDIETAQKLSGSDMPEILNYFSGDVWCPYEYSELKKILTNKCRSLRGIRFTEATERPDKYLTKENKVGIGVLNSLGIHVPNDQSSIWIDGAIQKIERGGLFIAAPQSHFDTKGLTKKGLGFFSVFETEIKDPIVFRYVRGGIQVLTKWGLEANDPALVVPKLN